MMTDKRSPPSARLPPQSSTGPSPGLWGALPSCPGQLAVPAAGAAALTGLSAEIEPPQLGQPHWQGFLREFSSHSRGRAAAARALSARRWRGRGRARRGGRALFWPRRAAGPHSGRAAAAPAQRWQLPAPGLCAGAMFVPAAARLLPRSGRSSFLSLLLLLLLLCPGGGSSPRRRPVGPPVVLGKSRGAAGRVLGGRAEPVSPVTHPRRGGAGGPGRCGLGTAAGSAPRPPRQRPGSAGSGARTERRLRSCPGAGSSARPGGGGSRLGGADVPEVSTALAWQRAGDRRGSL